MEKPQGCNSDPESRRVKKANPAPHHHHDMCGNCSGGLAVQALRLFNVFVRPPGSGKPQGCNEWKSRRVKIRTLRYINVFCLSHGLERNPLPNKGRRQSPTRHGKKWKGRRVTNRTLRYTSWPGCNPCGIEVAGTRRCARLGTKWKRRRVTIRTLRYTSSPVAFQHVLSLPLRPGGMQATKLCLAHP